MLSFQKSDNKKVCFFNSSDKKMCFPTACSNFYPAKLGWTVYGLSWCPYNKKANELLKSKGISYYYYDIEQEPFNSKENFKSMMKDYMGNQTTTPAIFKDGKLIGGYSNLSTYSF